VQTFLPYADFGESARALDTRRLGKQRVETLQIVRALTRPGNGWRHHPAVRMWRGYEEALGDESLHRSHQSALVRKNPEFYGPQFEDVPADLPYVWPDGAPAT